MQGVVLEAEDRDLKRRRNVSDYVDLRRRTCGGHLVFLLIEFTLNLPDSIAEDDRITSLTVQGVDMIMIVNVRSQTFYDLSLIAFSGSQFLLDGAVSQPR